MAGSEILTIGSIAKHRGEYNKDTTYYVNNQVTMYGCVFQALSTNFSNIPPLTVAEDKTISLANTNVWKCIINNVTLYNATLSTNNLDSRVSTIEGSVNTIKTTAQTANETAQSAIQKANTALSTANDTKSFATNLEQRVDDNQSRIETNIIAIEALQKNASPLEIICTTKSIAFEPDEDGRMNFSIPLYIYDNGTTITDKATVKAAIYTPVQTGLATLWNGTIVTATAYTPGKHSLEITASYQGKTARKEIEFYLTLPIIIEEIVDDSNVQITSQAVVELPLKVSVTKSNGNASELLFNIPSYLGVEKITCNGIDIPTIIDADSEENYTIVSTFEEVVSGTYDFIIQ